MEIARLLYKITGLTPRKFRVNECINFGNQLQKSIDNGIIPTNKDIETFLSHNLSRRNFNKISITNDSKVFFDCFTENEKASFKNFDDVNQIAGACHSEKNGKSLLYIPLENMNDPGTISHELQHLLTEKTTLRAKLAQIQYTLFPKSVENLENKYKEITSSSYLKVYNKILKLLHTTGKSDKELETMLSDFIKKDVLLPNNDKQNVKMLKIVALTMRDEARAYNVTSALEKDSYAKKGYAKLSKLMNDASKILIKEKNNVILNRIKSFFGIKSKNIQLKDVTQNSENLLANEVPVESNEILRMLNEKVLNIDEFLTTMPGLNKAEGAVKKSLVVDMLKKGEITEPSVKSELMSKLGITDAELQ